MKILGRERTYIIILTIIAITLLIVFGLWQLKPAVKPDVVTNQSSTTTQSQDISISSLPTGQVAHGPLPTLAPSLRGTEIDCPLKVDGQGQLVLTVGIRNCFDYFLSSLGEKTEPQLISDIRLYLTSTLPNTASPYALKLLDQYIAYLHAAQNQPQDKTPDHSPNSLHLAVQARNALRRQFFSPIEAEVFFGSEEAYDDFSIQQMQINADKSLTPEQKAAKIAALLNQLTPSVGDSMRPLMQYSELQQLTQDIKSIGGSAEELHQMRESLVGDAATARLEQLDITNTDWQQKINSYLTSRDQIMAGSNAASQQDEITALRNQTFSTPEERTRAQAYEAMHDSGVQPAQ